MSLAPISSIIILIIRVLTSYKRSLRSERIFWTAKLITWLAKPTSRLKSTLETVFFLFQLSPIMYTTLTDSNWKAQLQNAGVSHASRRSNCSSLLYARTQAVAYNNQCRPQFWFMHAHTRIVCIICFLPINNYFEGVRKDFCNYFLKVLGKMQKEVNDCGDQS